ncbi:hypothetical protein Anas_00498 [Armadillidium nasatum]|uniref:Major facilitator superfamily domain-containing protein 8 n=1 Tax=Armadillidium nasatum TaxID=96803 RepID=A0A5N5T3D6_9CRUS|nr:hypothetical protein Anas_00498 [Armadillidium nasatum]
MTKLSVIQFMEKKTRFRLYLATCIFIADSVTVDGTVILAMDPDKKKDLLGWVVAANPFGQLLASPFVGYLANHLGGIRKVCYGTTTIFTLGNLLYANVTLCRSYMASSTTMKERTTKIAILSAAQSSGFILGPLLQTIFTASIDGVKKYQATGWFAASLGIVNFILMTPWIFKECNIVEKEHHQKSAQTSSTSETSSSSSKPDLYSIAGLLTSYFFSMMIFVFMETLAVPLLTDQYAWGNDKAIIVVGVLTVCTGFVAIGMVFILKKFLYKYDDRKIVLFLGLVPILLGTFFYMPIYTNIPIPRSNCTENGETESVLAMYSYFVKLPTEGYHQPILSSTSDDQSISQYCTAGCPIDQTWCEDVSQIPLAQFLSANILIK